MSDDEKPKKKVEVKGFYRNIKCDIEKSTNEPEKEHCDPESNGEEEPKKNVEVKGFMKNIKKDIEESKKDE